MLLYFEMVVIFLLLAFVLKMPRTAASIACIAAFLLRDHLAAPVVRGYELTKQQSMRAAIFSPGDDHDVRMENVPVPDIWGGQLLVKVSAAALNPSNYKLSLARIPFVRHMKGGPPTPLTPCIPGSPHSIAKC